LRHFGNDGRETIHRQGWQCHSKSVKSGPTTYQKVKDGLATANGTAKVKPGEKVKIRVWLGKVG